MEVIISVDFHNVSWVMYRSGDVYVVSRFSNDTYGERHWTLDRASYLDQLGMVPMMLEAERNPF